MKRFYGTGVALVTPFKKDFSVDTDALEKIVEHVIRGGVEYLVVLGTTAESATLSPEEKQLVKKTIARANKGKLPMVLGIGGNNTAEVVEALRTTDLSDYEAVLSVSPYYNKPSQEGIYQHFKAISLASPKPVILYNVPSRTSSNIAPETVIKLAEDFDNIIGIKEAAGDIVQAMRLIKGTPENFLVISGDDMIALPMVLAGGAGVISVIGQGIPEHFSGLIRRGLDGETREAYQMHYASQRSIDLIFSEGNPAGIKAMLAELGLCRDVVRLPLVAASSQLKGEITGFLKGMLNLS